MPDFKKILEKLVALVTEHPHIQEVHFLENGDYTLNAHRFDRDGQLYSRIHPDAATAKDPSALQDQYKIVGTATREDILEAGEAAAKQQAESASPASEAGAVPESSAASAPEPQASAPAPEPAAAAPVEPTENTGPAAGSEAAPVEPAQN